MSDAQVSRILTLVFTDIADSTALKTHLGGQFVSELIARHRERVANAVELPQQVDAKLHERVIPGNERSALQ